MKRLLPAATALAVLGGCNLFGPTVNSPEAFQGWFHLDRPGRATSIAFSGSGNAALVRDFGCDGALNGETPWQADGDGLVLTQWGGFPRFAPTSSTQGALVATPGMYGQAPETWLPGATCLVCPAGDAGVAVACDIPAVLDGGT